MRQKFTQIVGILSLIFCFFSPPSFAAEGRFRQSIKMAGEEMAEFKVTVKGDSVYSESSLGELLTVFIKNSKGAYSYRPTEKSAIKIPEEVMPMNFKDYFDYETYLDEMKAVKIKTETIRGYKCNVYEYSDRSTELPTRVWVSTKDKFPIQIEAKSTPGPMLIEFFDLELNIAVDESLFEIPADTNMTDLTEAGVQF